MKLPELLFLYTELFHAVYYQCLKFQVDNFYSLEVMAKKKNSK